MAILVLIVNERNKVVFTVGMIETKEFEKVIKNAADLDLKCLSLADYVGDTFFNEKQMHYMKKELAILRQQKHVNSEVFDIIN